MFAYRNKWPIKEGRVQEAVELLKRPLEDPRFQEKDARIFFDPQNSPAPVVVWEETWEDPEAHDKFWAVDGELNAAEEMKAFWSKWADLVAGEIDLEIWTVLK